MSNDWLVGSPVNIVFYAALAELLAFHFNFESGSLRYTGTDVHIYTNQLDKAKIQLSREHRPLPKLEIIRRRDNLWEYEPDDFKITGWDPHEKITYPVAD